MYVKEYCGVKRGTVVYSVVAVVAVWIVHSKQAGIRCSSTAAAWSGLRNVSNSKRLVA